MTGEQVKRVTVEERQERWADLMRELPLAAERQGVELLPLPDARWALTDCATGDEQAIELHALLVAVFEAAVREDERERAGRVVRAFDKQFPPDGVGAPQSIADYDEDELNAIFDQLARTFYVERGIRSSDIHLSEEQP